MNEYQLRRRYHWNRQKCYLCVVWFGKKSKRSKEQVQNKLRKCEWSMNIKLEIKLDYHSTTDIQNSKNKYSYVKVDPVEDWFNKSNEQHLERD